ncbi:MAG TPA: glycosyltransferase family 39 protein [Gaiellaceae bacterium]|nr:glycosyltransferase family 39 protein [Gaiellaceae bacterium]
MARALRRTHVAIALGGLVVVSTLIHAALALRFTGLWIMPDEAIYGERALELWQHGTLSILHGDGAGYSVLYPVVAGLPLSLGRLTSGYDSLKIVQAFVMSLTAIPVYLYGRRLMRPWYALLAAALTLASPLLLYSGLVMTEVLIYPLGALALLAVARAVGTAGFRDQMLAFVLIGIAVLTRVQSIVLVLVLAVAAIVDSLLIRDRSRLRAFWPVWLVLAVVAVIALTSPAVFGAYAGTITGSYSPGRATGFAIDHLSYVLLETGIAPAAALVLLIADGLRRRGGVQQAERALLVVAAVTLVLVVVQVGLFASRFAPHLLGRDMALLPPILFLVFALWLDRGAPRPRAVATPLVLAIFVLLALTPWHRLVAANALPDTFGVAVLYSLGAEHAATAVAVTALVVLLLIAAAPGRALPALPALVLALLVASSAVAARDIARRVNYDQKNLVGTPPDWVTHATTAPVAYLYDGEAYWNGVWQVEFWNSNVRNVVSLAPYSVPGPLQQKVVHADNRGALPIRERYVVASDGHEFVGEPIARVEQTGVPEAGLTLWRLDGEPRLSSVEHDVLPNGDIRGPARLTVYDCAGGRLELTLIPKKTRVVTIRLEGRVVQRADIEGLPWWNGTVYAPQTGGPRVCHFELDPQGLLGSTKIDFVRR